jgi:hypothetical protein
MKAKVKNSFYQLESSWEIQDQQMNWDQMLMKTNKLKKYVWNKNISSTFNIIVLIRIIYTNTGERKIFDVYLI